MQRSKTLRIGVISTYPDTRDSISEYIQDLQDGLAKVKHGKYHFNYFPVKTVFFSNRDNEVWSIRSAEGFEKLLKKIRSTPLDVLHIHYASTFLGFSPDVNLIQHINFYYFLKQVNIPVVITAHLYFENDNLHDTIIQSFFTKKIAKLQHVTLILHSERKTRLLHKLVGAGATERIIYLPHGFPKKLLSINNDDLSYISKLKETYNLENKIILSTVGLISFWKGNLQILKNITPILKNTNNLIYLIAGSSNNSKKYLAECLRYIKSNNLQDQIILIDKFLTQQEIKCILHISTAHLSYHSFERHTSSGTITFAIACQCPVITNRIDFIANPEISQSVIICDGENEYTTKIKDIILNKNLQILYKQRCKQAASLFSWDVVASKYDKIFNNSQKELQKKSNAQSNSIDVFFRKPVSLRESFLLRKSLVKYEDKTLLIRLLRMPIIDRFEQISFLQDYFILFQFVIFKLLLTLGYIQFLN